MGRKIGHLNVSDYESLIGPELRQELWPRIFQGFSLVLVSRKWMQAYYREGKLICDSVRGGRKFYKSIFDVPMEELLDPESELFRETTERKRLSCFYILGEDFQALDIVLIKDSLIRLLLDDRATRDLIESRLPQGSCAELLIRDYIDFDEALNSFFCDWLERLAPIIEEEFSRIEERANCTVVDYVSVRCRGLKDFATQLQLINADILRQAQA